jgi:Wiskott-Aldrich syndrome protein
VPEVVEFYHSLMRRESKRDGSAAAGEPANGGGVATTRDMIGEIENRSAHLLAVRTVQLKHPSVTYVFVLVL